MGDLSTRTRVPSPWIIHPVINVLVIVKYALMMTSSNGDIFRVTGDFCGEFSGEFLAQRPVTRSFDVFFDLLLNKRLSKQCWGWWIVTPSRPWRHRNVKANPWFPNDINVIRADMVKIMLYLITWKHKKMRTFCIIIGLYRGKQWNILTWMNFDPAWISNYIHWKVLGFNYLSIPPFNGVAVEVWECISNFILNFTRHVITFSMLKLKFTHVSNRKPRKWGPIAIGVID